MDAISTGAGAILALVAMGLVFGALLSFAAMKLRVDAEPIMDIVDKIDALLPQTQCGQCGHPGCQPYAEAVVAGEEINLCIPGGETTAKTLAAMLKRPYKPVNSDPNAGPPPKLVAYIHEEECIGCTKCIQACPVDAIIGASKLMHTVIVDECTGCDLCVEPCPVDCIEMLPAPASPDAWIWDRPRGVGLAPGKLIPVRNLA